MQNTSSSSASLRASDVPLVRHSSKSFDHDGEGVSEEVASPSTVAVSPAFDPGDCCEHETLEPTDLNVIPRLSLSSTSALSKWAAAWRRAASSSAKFCKIFS
jgi:hypothetical protein